MRNHSDTLMCLKGGEDMRKLLALEINIQTHHISGKPMCAHKGARENAGLRLCTGGQSGVVTCLCATKLQKKYNQQETKPFYTNI